MQYGIMLSKAVHPDIHHQELGRGNSSGSLTSPTLEACPFVRDAMHVINDLGIWAYCFRCHSQREQRSRQSSNLNHDTRNKSALYGRLGVWCELTLLKQLTSFVPERTRENR